MKYLLMICGREDREPSTPRMTIEEWVTEADARGARLFGRPLRDPDTAATVRVRGGETLVTDGPFAELREHVAGFDVVDCADLDAALGLAADHPVAAWGAVEVRPFAHDFTPAPEFLAWAEREPPDSWVLFPCLDGVFAGQAVEDEIRRDAVAWGERLRERGVLVFGEPLASREAATTVRLVGGETVVSDGPFAETREYISGVCILHGGIDREVAITLAAQFPLAAHHCVEARRFMDP